MTPKGLLQTDKYKYIWTRDVGDGEYRGPLDAMRVDKDEGYEVYRFIINFLKKYKLDSIYHAHLIEDALHSPTLSNVVMREDLMNRIYSMISSKI
ncbi:hypothetical protein [Rheinheimera pleomorphica]|uniref:hypothetical protein n=1 Tax=Rheinheimera pleomorphica TaxID=2703963 RepID=UPI00141DEC63|nr:hypothetical protein [Rheinheimera pleomorphica]